MDDLTRAYFELSFKVAFMEKKGGEFQDLFSCIMEKRFPGDFMRVCPWGSAGDQKNDGYLRSRRMLFQVYAPNELRASDCVAKIEEDFTGALSHWRDHVDAWTFVHNSREGLGPQVTAKLLELAGQYSHVTLAHWGFEELRREAMQMSGPDLASLLGPAPSRTGMMELGLQDLAPVLDHIALLPAPAEPDLRPVPIDKLQLNLLSDSAANLLKAGMTRVLLVRKYFKYKPTLQDQIAESFRSRYRELRSTSATPDDVFHGLQCFAVGDAIPSPSRLNAVFAVLAFFFEECDIFERPHGSDGAP